MNLPSREGRVVRASTPPRHGGETEEREVLWMLSRRGSPSVRADLVAFTDAIELETFTDGTFRRRWRFLRDTTARQYADRLKRRLLSRGFVDRRGDKRTTAWPT